MAVATNRYVSLPTPPPLPTPPKDQSQLQDYVNNFITSGDTSEEYSGEVLYLPQSQLTRFQIDELNTVVIYSLITPDRDLCVKEVLANLSSEESDYNEEEAVVVSEENVGDGVNESSTDEVNDENLHNLEEIDGMLYIQ